MMIKTKSRVAKSVALLAGKVAILVALLAWDGIAHGAYIWIEGEHPTTASVTRHPWWYDKVKKNLLSGGDYISNWDPNNAGQLTYTFDSPNEGPYEFWIRANPVQASLLYRLDGGAWTKINTTDNLVDYTNIAEDGQVDLRYIAWIKVGSVQLKQGSNTIMFRMDSQNNHCGAIDCFVFSTTPFTPHGFLKPDEAVPSSMSDEGWFPFNPPADSFMESPIDLRFLNEKTAGDGGFIEARDGEFVHSNTGQPVRFWGVNGPPDDLKDVGELQKLAKTLAKRGVNLVRIHAADFDDAGQLDPQRVQHMIDVVNAMKGEGIYCHLSVFYYLTLAPKPQTPWLMGYDGKTHPTAALFFNPDFQEQYFKWWSSLLVTPDPRTGKRLIDEPAVAGLEITNEDSDLFWTFRKEGIPGEQWQIIETQFGQWAAKKYGSADAALTAWNNATVPDDAPALGRLGLRPMWQIIKEKTLRDQDTVRFLVETERRFYSDTERKLREMGFKGVITTSNWTTASPELLDPLEKYMESACDFNDRHAYFGSDTTGDSADWSIRDGQTYLDRSLLKFDPHIPGDPRPLSSPVMDPHFDGKPSMLSEVALSRPDRYRSEAPLYLAAYGSLQGSNAIEHFALDGHTWTVKPGYFMQPWTAMAPSTMGQFPAAALIYRRQLIDAGATVVNVKLNVDDLIALHGGPTRGLLSDLDEKVPVNEGGDVQAGEAIDPLACFVGRTAVHFVEGKTSAHVESLSPYVDRTHHAVTSSNGQLKLDYEHGILKIDSPRAQGVSGNLAAAGEVRLGDLTISSPLELGHIVVVSLDDQPLATSGKMLLQVMSEERPSGFQTMPAGNGRKQILHYGNDPWMVKAITGTVKMKRADAGTLKVIPLDGNGYPVQGGKVGSGEGITLDPDGVYYVIER